MARHLAASAGQPHDELSALLITNNRILAELYQLKLSLDGYELRTLGRTADLPTNVAEPDLLFFDVGDGAPEAVAAWVHLRIHPALGTVPAVVLSTERAQVLDERGFRLGPLDHVVPVARFTEMSSLIEVEGLVRIPR